MPESSTARDSTCGASPRLANSPRNIRAGRTSATYWSPAITFRPTPLRVDRERSATRAPGARDDRLEQPLRGSPACSITAANESAPSTSQIGGQQAGHAAAGEQLRRWLGRRSC